MKSIFSKKYLMYLQYNINIVHNEKYFVKLCFIFIKTIWKSAIMLYIKYLFLIFIYTCI